MLFIASNLNKINILIKLKTKNNGKIRNNSKKIS